MKTEFEELEAQAEEYMEICGRAENVFAINPEKAALVIIDMQNFVCSPKDGRRLEGLDSVIESINALAENCRSSNVPVIWLRHNFERDNGGDNAGLYPLFHRRPISAGMFNEGPDTEIYEGMNFDPERDITVFKNRYSAFAPGSSSLKEVLSGLGTEQLWICGVATNVCVECTARDAMQSGFETILISDATASSFELIHKITLLNFRLFFGDVRSMKGLLSVLPKKGN
ncbi:cysteine hydrolase family protein [Methanolacinia paynteri]|uniref:cysteine hydrolase family protein n=1 Tax=Methanolacinia paynteri TaxID=230356 RepID=UPI000693399B|nr:cysteine hydrolase [Methanolacinia paynteri]